MNLGKVTKELGREIDSLWSQSDNLDSETFKDALIELHTIATMATLTLYKASALRKDACEKLFPFVNYVVVFKGGSPILQKETEIFLRDIQLGKFAPLDLSDTKTPGDAGTEVIRQLYNILSYYRSHGSDAANRYLYLRFKDKPEVPKLPEELYQRIRELPELLLKHRNVWAKCMRDFYLLFPYFIYTEKTRNEFDRKAEERANSKLKSWKNKKLDNEKDAYDKYTALDNQQKIEIANKEISKQAVFTDSEKLDYINKKKKTEFEKRKKKIANTPLKEGRINTGLLDYIKDRLESLVRE